MRRLLFNKGILKLSGLKFKIQSKPVDETSEEGGGGYDTLVLLSDQSRNYVCVGGGSPLVRLNITQKFH